MEQLRVLVSTGLITFFFFNLLLFLTHSLAFFFNVIRLSFFFLELFPQWTVAGALGHSGAPALELVTSV